LAIVGSGGGLGHLGLQFAKAEGLRVIGFDARDEDSAMSKTNGADVVVNATMGKAEAAGEVQKVTGGEGAAATIVLTDAPDTTALDVRSPEYRR
jgi:D-arabinose 1-dehydrogenase-like Zn-dependent alcohol dehydrogenase